MNRLALFFVSGCLMAQAADSYRNPIIKGTLADPTVIFHEGRYYLYATGDVTGGNGYRAYTSTDLVNWQRGPVVFQTDQRNVWAPDVWRDPVSGRFYLYYTANRTVGVAMADGPLGPFTNPHKLFDHAIDAHLFRDDDGRLYLYFVRVPGFLITVQPMRTPTEPMGEPKVVLHPESDWEKRAGHVTEGPWMIKRGKLYYLLYSGSGANTPDYAVGYATATSPLGPFQRAPHNPILHRSEGLFGPGHGCAIQDRAGQWWFVYHQKNTAKIAWDRFICLDPLRFDAQGRLFGAATRNTEQTAPITAAAVTKPNIVFFLVDDMGWQETSVPFHTEVTALNRRYRTPNMERLAAQGMKFTQAYASAVCSPTRVSALTGMNVARHRVTNWTLRKNVSPDQKHKFIQPPDWNMNGICTEAGVERTMQVTPLPSLLREAGYRTIHVGKAHFGAIGTPGENPLNLGFDVNIAGHAAGGPGSYWGEKNFSAAWRTKPPEHIWDVPGLEAYHGKDIYLTEALTLEAIKAVEKSVADKKPFYLYMAHYAVHAPWEKDDRFYQKYIEAGLKPFEATLASMIEGMDKSLGDLMATLKRLGIEDNTIILFMSDNGSPSRCPPNLPLRGHKVSPYEGGIREPMIVKWPGVTKAGSICREMVVIEDFFPTILELAGAAGKSLQTVDGVSFVPLLKQAGKTAADRAFVWHFPNNYAGQTPFSAIRVGPWKLIYHHADRRLELFNIAEDISEKNELAAQQPEKTKELAARLTQLLKERGAQMPTDTRTGQPVEYPAIAKKP